MLTLVAIKVLPEHLSSNPQSREPTAQSVPGISLSPDAIRAVADAGLSLAVHVVLYSLDEN
jgi:hypothetical protein